MLLYSVYLSCTKNSECSRFGLISDPFQGGIPRLYRGKTSKGEALMLRSVLVFFVLTLPTYAEGEQAADFDYYVLALSWTPNWCVLEGDRRQSPQCDTGRGFGFTLHGLWPQYEGGGWPSFCPTSRSAPSRRMTTNMVDIMGTSGLAWHQWKKHGTCSGQSAADYFALSRAAYAKVTRPDIFRKLKQDITLPAHVVEDAFLEVNPTLSENQITITCKSNYIQEVRVCLTKELEFRACGKGVTHDCTLEDAELHKMR